MTHILSHLTSVSLKYILRHLISVSKVTLLAWYQLRQQHLVALVEKIENQGVLVMVTFLHLSATCALSIKHKFLPCRLWRTRGALRLVYWSLAWVCSFTG